MVDFSPFLPRDTTLAISCLRSCTPSPFWNSIYSTRKEFGRKFLLFRVGSISVWSLTKFDNATSPESVSNHLILCFFFFFFFFCSPETLRQPSDVFSAVWIENTAVAVNDVLKFTRILLNENDVYDAHTGEYTAPVNGTYMFTSNLCTHDNTYAHIAFLADDTLIGAFFAGDRDWNVCSYSSAISRLEKGMKVKVAITRRYGSGDIFRNNNSGYLSTFAGHRIDWYCSVWKLEQCDITAQCSWDMTFHFTRLD